MATTQASEYVGTIGVLCGAETVERVVRLTPSGPLHVATCNRWTGHDGEHWHTVCKPKGGFIRLHTFTDAERRTPDWRELKRIEMATAARERREQS